MPYHGVPHDFFRYTEQGLATVVQDAGLLTAASFTGGTRRSVLSHLSGLQSNEVPESVLSRHGAHDWTQIAQEERASAEPGVEVRWYNGVGAVAFRSVNSTSAPTAVIKSWRRDDAALHWLSSSLPGFCGKTEYHVDGRCAQSGARRLTANETTDWLVAMEACATSCQRRCGSRCAYISVSLTHADCSYFQACELSHLSQDFQASAPPPSSRAGGDRTAMSSSSSGVAAVAVEAVGGIPDVLFYIIQI